MRAHRVKNKRIDFLLNLPTIFKILESYSVGTQKHGMNIPSPLAENEIIPLGQYIIKSNIQLTKEIMGQTHDSLHDITLNKN